MYSGTTLKGSRHFDVWFGAHQKIDRVARQQLDVLIPDAKDVFPAWRKITRFEGIDGPDGIKRKNPGGEEPWHFYDPKGKGNERILSDINAHYVSLVTSIQERNETRMAFEAAWLAHAIVDGLTPAHHYPYEAELAKLRGAGRETRDSVKEQVLLPGETISKRLRNNWRMWGDKGLAATHFTFEWGVTIVAMPPRLSKHLPTEADVAYSTNHGIEALFKQQAERIANLHMYEDFYRSGWTPRLARQVRRELMPTIVNCVTLAWILALKEARA
jgi:hypothetical protein